ncbi:MAG TPA: histidine kinase dimerization/phospho-acceptor domain-containing protein [Gemmatimonadaceae bacterium]|nr:histidine kinase dimerization/phospho-acceptor domain-containing protein [Gemmatimonadaceae bacterium]
MTAIAIPRPDELTVLLLIAEGEDRVSLLRTQIVMIFPRATVRTVDLQVLAEGKLPHADVAVVDSGPLIRTTADALRLLRARGFHAPIVVVASVPDDAVLRSTTDPLGATCVARSDASPIELGTALATALGSDANQSPELVQLRRTFAAGQVALSLQHGINNPLAALLAETQLLQLEDLTSEQRASADRMVELCRRIVGLVRRLDVFGDH